MRPTNEDAAGLDSTDKLKKKNREGKMKKTYLIWQTEAEKIRKDVDTEGL